MPDGQRLSGRKVAVFLGEGFEDLEFWVTVMRLQEEGADVKVVGIAAGQTVRGKHALEATSDVAAKDVSADDFDAWSCPAGGPRTSSAGTRRSPAWWPRPTARARSSV